MNQYGSAVRTYIAANVMEELITPPNQLDVTNSNIRKQFFQMGGSIQNPAFINSGVDDWNLQSNFSIHRCGLFSNFADGLVYLAPCVRPSITIKAFPWKVNVALPGTVSMTAGSRDLVGFATTWNTVGPGKLTVGRYYAINGHLLEITKVNSDTSAEASQYVGLIDVAGISGQTMYSTIGGSLFVQNVLPCIDTLNYMYEADRFEPISLVNVIGYTAIALQAILSFSDTVSFGTKSIDTAWARTIATFDVKADLEITIGVP
jgi:hypothetical protein